MGKAKPMSVDDLISDWVSFEEFIASICQTGDVSVERNVILTGKSGVPRQIDVAIRATQGLTNHLVLVECKYWRRRVTRQHVDSLITAIHDLNASRGIFFSTQGFQEGAITLAKHEGVELFKLRDLELSERFGPSTPLGEYRHYLWRSLRNVQLPGIHCWQRDLSHFNITMTLGGHEPSKTTVINTNDYPSGTLEGIIDSWSHQAATAMALEAKGLLFDGAGGVRRFWRKVRQTADVPIQVPVGDAVAIIPVISYDLGVTLWQEHREVDKNLYKFVVAVEDCILGVVHKAVREAGATKTDITTAANRARHTEDDLQGIMAMSEFVPFEFDRMAKGQFYDKPGFPEFIPMAMIAKWRDLR